MKSKKHKKSNAAERIIKCLLSKNVYVAYECVCVDVMNDMIMFTNILLFFILSHFAAL